jgi:hypothetical protein
VPVLETIDESQTLDFAKHPSLKIVVKGKPLTPISENTNEKVSPIPEVITSNTKEVEESLPVAEISLNTKEPSNKMDPSIMQAINKRRKSYNATKGNPNFNPKAYS